MMDQMYSKFGRMIEKQIRILKGRKDILAGKSPKYDAQLPKATPLLTQHPADAKPKKLPVKKLRKSAVFQSQSREVYNQVHSPKTTTPPAGYYECKYDFIHKRAQTPVITKSKVKVRQRFRRQQESILTPEKIRRHVQQIDFGKYLERRSITSNFPDVHEDRFKSFNYFPSNHSKFRKTSSPSIEKSLGRIDPPIKLGSAVTYNVNYSQVEKNNDRVFVSFSKFRPRDQPNRSQYNDLSYDRISYSAIDKKARLCDFSKQSTRGWESPEKQDSVSLMYNSKYQDQY